MPIRNKTLIGCLRGSIIRLKYKQDKAKAIAVQQRRDIAQLLEQGKFKSAEIRVESVILSDIMTELYELIQLYCELLTARFGLLNALPASKSGHRVCNPGLEEAVKTIIFVAPQIDVKDLPDVRIFLMEKFGPDFTKSLMENSETAIPPGVLRRLRVDPPERGLVEKYLKAIAETYKVPWPEEESKPPTDKPAGDDDNPSNKQAVDDNSRIQPADSTDDRTIKPTLEEELSRAIPPSNVGPRSPIGVPPPHPTSENASPLIQLPTPPVLTPAYVTGSSKDSGNSVPRSLNPAPGTIEPPSKPKIVDVDDLNKRFRALKSNPWGGIE
ncbi:MAG: hypothetical protein M1829_005447 [Trizodia sp. TS-e1964]|nr:MAG: hypothetical protein M1829_005447 [Trizodia sp. TS-e1964]